MQRRHLPTVTAALASVAAAAAPAALGQEERAPRIERVLDATRQPASTHVPGGVVLLEGRRLWEPPPPPAGSDAAKRRAWETSRLDGIEVRVDGRPILVLESSATLVTCILPPDLAPGTKQVRVSVEGQGSTTLTLRVVARAAGPSPSEEEHEGRPQRADPVVLRIERFERRSTPQGDVFLVEGVAPGWPDGLRVRLGLGYEGRTSAAIAERSADVRGGRFHATFGPYTRRLLVGNYSLELLFSLASQSQGAVREWLRKLPREQWPLYKRVQRRAHTAVGGTGQGGDIEKKDLEAQEQELKAHCKELAAKAEALMRKAQYGYAVAARCFYRGSGAHSYDKAAYKKYLLENKFAADPAEVEKIVRDTSLAGERGHFQSDAYTQWATGFLAELRALYKKHEDFNSRYVCPMDERAERLGHYLLSNVLKLFQRWSGSLYDHAKQDLPREIAQVPFVVISAPTVSVPYFEAKKAELLKAVGL